ncbi:MAG: hypothetical protein ACPL3C_12400 [Pyrobaculum sp.]
MRLSYMAFKRRSTADGEVVSISSHPPPVHSSTASYLFLLMFSFKWWSEFTIRYFEDAEAEPTRAHILKTVVEDNYEATAKPTISMPARELEQIAYLMAEGASKLRVSSSRHEYLDKTGVRHEPAIYVVV